MKSRLLFICFFSGFLILLSGNSSGQANKTNALTLEDIFASTKLLGKSVVNIQWTADGSGFTYTELHRFTKMTDYFMKNL